jgi:hypothetical protein
VDGIRLVVGRSGRARRASLRPPDRGDGSACFAVRVGSSRNGRSDDRGRATVVAAPGRTRLTTSTIQCGCVASLEPVGSPYSTARERARAPRRGPVLSLRLLVKRERASY